MALVCRSGVSRRDNFGIVATARAFDMIGLDDLLETRNVGLREVNRGLRLGEKNL